MTHPRRSHAAIGETSGEDEAALRGALAGDAGGRAAFVDRFAPLVYSVLANAGVDERRLEDLFAAVFVALFDRDARRLRLWNGRCALASWIRLVTSSVLIDQLRRDRAERLVESASDWLDEVATDEPQAIERLAHMEDLARVGRALASLSESDQGLVKALCCDEREPGEVARELGIAIGALYTRKNRALERLRRAYDALVTVGL